jgi:hypothetical protein
MNIHRIASITLFWTVTVLVLLLNVYYEITAVYNYYNVIFYGIALVGYGLSTIFYYAARNLFRKAALSPFEITLAWFWMLFFMGINFLASSFGLDEMNLINLW